jgi:exonuclease 3'-5' domain-containing protein 1
MSRVREATLVHVPPIRFTMPYTLCDDETRAKYAADVISRESVFFLDCEGRDLGNRGGALGLISMGVAGTDDVFLFDMLSLDSQSPAILSLLSLIGNEKVRKIVWDGRMDNVALWEKYGVVLAGTLDLQIVEIDSRSARGEDDLNRRQRLIRAVGPGQALHKPEKYEHVHGLCGLDGCLRDLKIGMEYVKDSE